MPQLAAVVLKNDAQVDHTFNPRGIAGGVATLVNSTGVPIGDKRVTISHARTANGRDKITLRVALPIVQDVVVAGISKPTVVRSAFADMTFTVDQTSSTAERADILAFAWSLLGHSVTRDLVADLEDLY
jgi:hypothetical protein